MLGLKNIIIAVGISLAIGLCVGLYTGYSFTADHYQAKIDKERSAAKDTLIAEQSRLLTQERKNSEIQNKLDRLANEYASKRDADGATIRSLLARSPERVYSKSVCETSTGTSNLPSSAASDGPASGQLSEDFREYLVTTLRAADEAAAYAEVAHEYAKQIELQRERLKNE